MDSAGLTTILIHLAQNREKEMMPTSDNSDRSSSEAMAAATPKTYFWSEHEHLRFMALFQRLGNQWKAIAKHMDGRTALQCRTHGQKFILSLKQFEA